MNNSKHQKRGIKIKGILLGLISEPEDVELFHSKNAKTHFEVLEKYGVKIYLAKVKPGWQPLTMFIFQNNELIAEI